MTDLDTAIVVKALDPVRVAIAAEPADGFDVEFAPIFGRLYPALFGELDRLGIAPAGPTYGLYYQRDDERIDVCAGVVIAPDADLPDHADPTSPAISIRDLPAASRAATLVHRGSMDTVADSFALLDQWIVHAQEQILGLGREVYLDCPPDDPQAWVTELQFVLA